MKNIVALFFALIFMYQSEVFTQPQSITVVFKSRYYGQYIRPDSILVKNRKRNCDTMLYYPDTTLTLYYTVGINKQKHEPQLRFRLTGCYPNPVSVKKTSFDVLLFNKSNVTISVFDMTGKRVALLKKVLNRGKHIFDFYPSGKGNYLILVQTEYGSRSVKTICTSTENSSFGLELRKTENNPEEYKNSYAGNTFWFEPGDTLRYICYAYTPQEVKGSDVIENRPQVATEFVNFHIIEGLPCYGTEAVNYEGHLYKTVQIGNQCWLKENLNVGVMINGDENMSDNGIIEKYCYDNDTLNCNEYGGLYQWDEMMQYTTGESARGICPDGWHVASKAEWEELTFNRNGNELKEQGTSHWAAGNAGNNISGFTALAGGYKWYDNGTFEQLKTLASFFTSTEMQPPYWGAWYNELYFNGSMVSGGNAYKTHGISVRCIKDQ